MARLVAKEATGVGKHRYRVAEALTQGCQGRRRKGGRPQKASGHAGSKEPSPKSAKAAPDATVPNAWCGVAACDQMVAKEATGGGTTIG